MKLYVGTYAKYNNGSIAGRWMDVEDYADADDFYAACRELHSDEHDPEFMFQDYEGFPDDFYCECDARPVFEYKEALNHSGMDKAAFDAGIACGLNLDQIEDCYCGEYDSPEDYAETLCEDCGDLANVPDMVRDCIDWSLLWQKYLRFDYTYHEGYVFRDN